MTATEIYLTVNGRSHKRSVEPRMLLADFLRHELRFTGTHVACAHGVCGACTIDFNGTTVEGLAGDGPMTAVQHAFREHHALQCGFCTPGFLMTATELLRSNQAPTESEIKDAIGGNLCRCTGYINIVKAVQGAAASLAEGKSSARRPMVEDER